MDQRQRRKGVVDNLNSAINTAQNIQRATKIGRAVTGAAEIASTSQIWIPAAIVIAVILIIVFIILLGGGTGAALELGKQPNPGGPGGGSGNGNVSSCQFTRSGTQSPIKSSILAGWITDAANKASIPPAVLSSVAMHENAGFVTSIDNNDSRISSNYFCNEGAVFCEGVGQNLHSGSCSGAELAGGARDARAVGLMQIVDVYHPGGNLCSITESLSIAAQKLKDSGVTSQPTQDQINTAIERYHNSCAYGSYSYCGEVWQDYQNCQTSISASAFGWPTSGTLTQGPQGGTDHKTNIYDLNSGKDQAVDIANTTGTPIYSTINGKVQKVTPCSGACNTGYGNEVDLVDATGKFTVIYGHFSDIVVSDNSIVAPGTLLGHMGSTGHSTGPHLHFEFRNLPLAPPNIPEAITPPDCDWDPATDIGIRCSPYSVYVSATTPSPPASPQDQYWLVLDRQSKEEYLYKGQPGNKDASTLIRSFMVNPGASGSTPTPLSNLVYPAREYWIINAAALDSPIPSDPHFLHLDIPFDNPNGGPTPYTECGGLQCRWIPGTFGLHSSDMTHPVVGPGSSGCIRHYSQDIDYLWSLLQNIVNSREYSVRYYVKDGWSP
ncbi:MAG: peptidoglycan DD-metalloendopeptidase family protein [Patescibacteria group bacterium]|nr:peptidoglycan DD-metalloendopeptidase family protein [Patescibacteria group bacterium]